MGPQTKCPQNLVRAHKTLRPGARAVASLIVPGGQEFHFLTFSSNVNQVFLCFLKLYLFSSSFWPSRWASCPPGKALATPLPGPQMAFENVGSFQYLMYITDTSIWKIKSGSEKKKKKKNIDSPQLFNTRSPNCSWNVLLFFDPWASYDWDMVCLLTYWFSLKISCTP